MKTGGQLLSLERWHRWLLLLCCLSGCAYVVESTGYRDQVVSIRSETLQRPESVVTKLDTALDADTITVRVERKVGCEDVEHRTVHRTVVTERRAPPYTLYGSDSDEQAGWAITGWLALAGSITTTGVLADRMASEPESTQAAFGVGAAIVGAAALALALPPTLDAVELMDDEVDVGVVQLPPASRPRICELPVIGEQVALLLPDGRMVTKTVEREGTVRFDLPDDSTLLRWRNNPTFKVVVAGETEDVSFASLPRFRVALARQQATYQKFLEAQAAAERSLQSVAKGDSLWVQLNPEVTCELDSVVVNHQDGNLMYALNARGELIRSDNGGIDWSVVLDPVLQGKSLTHISLDAIDAHIVLGATATGEMFVSRDDGVSWLAIDLAPRDDAAGEGPPEEEEADLLRVVLVARDPAGVGSAGSGSGALEVVLAATADGLFRRTLQADSAWLRVEGLPPGGVRSVSSSPNQHGLLLVVMSSGDVLKSTDGGRQWKALDVAGLLEVGISPREVIVHPTDANLLYVLAGDNGILRSRDGGQNFERATDALPTGLLITTLRMDPNNPTVVYAGTNAGIIYSTDMASSFRPMNTGIDDAGLLRVVGLDVSGRDLYAFAGPSVGLLKLGTVKDKQTLSNISFGVDSDVIKPSLRPQLRRVAAILKRNPDVLVRVDGHTDSQGTLEHNKDLSVRRAKAVCDLLEGEGVSRARLVPAGFGPRYPVDTNDTDKGRQKNRRVEIFMVASHGIQDEGRHHSNRGRRGLP